MERSNEASKHLCEGQFETQIKALPNTHVSFSISFLMSMIIYYIIDDKQVADCLIKLPLRHMVLPSFEFDVASD